MGVMANVARKRRNLRLLRDRHPRFTEAVAADVSIALRSRGEEPSSGTRLDLLLQAARLCWTSDAFAGLALYRAKAAMQRRGVPVIPKLTHHLAISIGQICIGDPVVVAPGVYVPHGQVVVDGFTEIHSGVRLLPFCTIGLRTRSWTGPTLAENVTVGSGARILGDVTIGPGAQVGANAVVLQDIPARHLAVGVPAEPRPPRSQPPLP